MEKYIIHLQNEKKTMALGAKLASVCQKACIIYIYGEIGVGKTTFCRGFINELGYLGNIISPTYTICEVYALKKWTVYHFDLYRLSVPEDLELIGIRDNLYKKNVLCLVEWPQHGIGMLPHADIELTLKYDGKSRHAEVKVLRNSIISNMSHI